MYFTRKISNWIGTWSKQICCIDRTDYRGNECIQNKCFVLLSGVCPNSVYCVNSLILRWVLFLLLFKFWIYSMFVGKTILCRHAEYACCAESYVNFFYVFTNPITDPLEFVLRMSETGSVYWVNWIRLEFECIFGLLATKLYIVCHYSYELEPTSTQLSLTMCVCVCASAVKTTNTNIQHVNNGMSVILLYK